MIAFVSMIVDDIQDYFDASLVKGFYHISEFIDMFACVSVDAVPLVRCKVPHGAIAPVIN